jgi:hypothetical protein
LRAERRPQVELFKEVTKRGTYLVGYLVDGWTRELKVEAGSPAEAAIKTQNVLGSICDVTYVELI